IPVAANTVVSFTATANGIKTGAGGTLTLKPIGVTSLSLAPNPVQGGKSVTGTVTLDRAAAPADIVVSLTSTKAGVAPGPASLTTPKGSQKATFTINTTGVASTTSVTISAKVAANGVTKSIVLSVTH